MYKKRVKIFVLLGIVLLTVCLARLTQMQLLSSSYYRGKIAQLKLRRGRYHRLNTIRGKILDRKSRPLALDEPGFQLSINYDLSCYADERVVKAKLLKASSQADPNRALDRLQKQTETKLNQLENVID